jgi:phage portal protein BeeE
LRGEADDGPRTRDLRLGKPCRPKRRNDSDLAFETQFVKFELDGLLRADAAARAEVYAKALDPATGWMRREEVRRLEGLEPER